MRKYSLTTIRHPKNKLLRQIVAERDIGPSIKAGTLGGFVESEKNLSQAGDCWVFDGATVSGDAVVRGMATVQYSHISDEAAIEGKSAVIGSVVDGCAYVGGWAVVADSQLTGNDVVAGSAVANSVNNTSGWHVDLGAAMPLCWLEATRKQPLR